MKNQIIDKMKSFLIENFDISSNALNDEGIFDKNLFGFDLDLQGREVIAILFLLEAEFDIVFPEDFFFDKENITINKIAQLVLEMLKTKNKLLK